MKVGGKVAHKVRTGDVESDRLLHEFHAARKLEKMRHTDSNWKMAAAAASDRRLLIGNSKVFRSPR